MNVTGESLVNKKAPCLCGQWVNSDSLLGLYILFNGKHPTGSELFVWTKHFALEFRLFYLRSKCFDWIFLSTYIYKHGPSHHKVVPTAINLANRVTHRHTAAAADTENLPGWDIKFHYFKLCETENLILQSDQRERNNLEQNNWKRLSEHGGEWRTDGPRA